MKEKKAAEVLKINVDQSCDFVCESCERYFECEAEEKKLMYDRRRMDLAREAMSRIKHKIAVVGGKGGVGKSITTVNLAMALALRGRKVCILDQDFDGSCVPKMLGLLGKRLTMGEKGILPVSGPRDIKVISMGSILEDEEVLTWFHDMRRNATEEFLSHVEYGINDYLLIDMPPGTSSDSVNMMQYIPDLDGAIVVTIPSEVSQGVAKKAILLCKKAKVRILGVIENMSGFVCPHCGQPTDILLSGGGAKLAQEMEVPFLGKIPLDARLARASDNGTPYASAYPDSEAAKALEKMVDKIEEAIGWAG
jgi:ATP-binding protein involved in chromosome partitioning